MTRKLESSIKNHQKDRDLKIDGKMHPGGETESSVMRDLYRRKISDDIQKEELPPPNIPGTNIPDEGIPEAYVPRQQELERMHRWRYNIDRGIETKSLSIDPNLDPGIFLPYYPLDPTRNFSIRKKYRDA